MIKIVQLLSIMTALVCFNSQAKAVQKDLRIQNNGEIAITIYCGSAEKQQYMISFLRGKKGFAQSGAYMRGYDIYGVPRTCGENDLPDCVCSIYAFGGNKLSELTFKVQPITQWTGGKTFQNDLKPVLTYEENTATLQTTLPTYLAKLVSEI